MGNGFSNISMGRQGIQRDQYYPQKTLKENNPKRKKEEEEEEEAHQITYNKMRRQS